MPDFSPPLSSLIDGTWAKLWREHQGLPPHLIDNMAPTLRCTCGYEADSVAEWSAHVATALGDESQGVSERLAARRGEGCQSNEEPV
jgi:hypothetical protein